MQNWKSEIQDHIKHFDKKVAICSCIAYCDCHRHQTLSILFVQTCYKGVYQFPGGRRDKAGTGRAQFRKADEPCWEAIISEFDEEVGEKLTNFTKAPCEFFHCRTPRGQIVRVYYLKINCQEIPDKNYGRLRLYETIQRKWIELEDIAHHMLIQQQDSPSIFGNAKRTLKTFGTIIQKISQQQKLEDDQQIIKRYKIDQLFRLIGSGRIQQDQQEVIVDIELEGIIADQQQLAQASVV